MLQNLMQRYLDFTNPLKATATRVIAVTTDNPDNAFNLGPESERRRIISNILSEVDRIVAANDRVLANRRFFTQAMLGMSRVLVLLIAPKETLGRGLLNEPGISGELREHLAKIIRADKELAEQLYGAGADLEQLSNSQAFDGCVALYNVSLLTLIVADAIRRALGDCHEVPEKDWYHPFLHAMCVWDEHNYRRAIKLSPALDSPDPEMEALRYSLFMNIVLRGERFPDVAWNRLPRVGAQK